MGWSAQQVFKVFLRIRHPTALSPDREPSLARPRHSELAHFPASLTHETTLVITTIQSALQFVISARRRLRNNCVMKGPIPFPFPGPRLCSSEEPVPAILKRDCIAKNRRVLDVSIPLRLVLPKDTAAVRRKRLSTVPCVFAALRLCVKSFVHRYRHLSSIGLAPAFPILLCLVINTATYG